MTDRVVGLPMPKSRELALGSAPRPRIRRSDSARFPFPVPNGWFIVARAGEIAPGDVVPLYYFGQDLVLYREENGTPRIVEAYCAHLGAHIAVGGRVEDTCVVCPFHGWKYDGATGKCTSIPYTESPHIPSQAKIRAFPTLERNHMIWAWHHADGGDPFYEVPVVPEFDDADWLPPFTHEFFVATSCQEMAENNHDFAHFKYVHGAADIPSGDIEIKGPYKRVLADGGNWVRETFGLGLGLQRRSGTMVFLSSTTPIDQENVHVRWTLTSPRTSGPDAAKEIADLLVAGVSQDIPIWENKVYRDRPVLAKEERTILDHREWAQQFYSPPP